MGLQAKKGIHVKTFIYFPQHIFQDFRDERPFCRPFCGELLNFVEKQISLKWLYPIEEKYKGTLFAEFFNAKECLSQQFQMFPKLTIAQLCFT